MFLAYLDEIGETGAFVSRADPRYKTSPAFGYAGFVIPDEYARKFGAAFTVKKRTVFAPKLADVDDVARWERKGSSIFRSDTHRLYPQQLRVFDGLVRMVRHFNGRLFNYANEKPLGTPRQTRLDTVAREAEAMRETFNRLAIHAKRCGENRDCCTDG